MKLNRLELAGIISALVLACLGATFAFSATTAHADVFDDLCQVGMGIFAQCNDDAQTNSDPCDLPGMAANPNCNGSNEGPSMAEQINCEIYAQLAAAGEPIPESFDENQCTDSEEGGGNGGGGNGGGGSGGGGSTTPACSDGYDNDTDGLFDLTDPGCVDAQDTDETDPVVGGGSGGSGGGGGGGYLTSATSTSGGGVLGTATSTASCDMYLTAFIKFGAQNDVDQVKRLQHVLKAFEGASVEENGVYDQATLSAVHAFQTKYWDTILAPWDIKESTGFVYLTTRKKVNEIYCSNEKTFPLSTEENTLIEKTKTPTKTTVAKPVTRPVTTPVKTEEEKSVPTTNPTTTGSPVSRPWGAVGDFFRRLFNRDR